MLNLKIETIFDTKYCQRTFLEKLSGKPSIMKVPFFQHPARKGESHTSPLSRSEGHRLSYCLVRIICDRKPMSVALGLCPLLRAHTP